MRKMIDISVPLYTGMVFYPGDAEPAIEPGKQISSGDTSNLSDISLGSHSGTHVDAPRHFIDGEKPVDLLELDALIGAVSVLDLSEASGTIEADDLKAAGLAAEPNKRVLLKTSNSSLWTDAYFHKDFIALGNSGADMMVELGVRLVGIDYLSIETFHPETYYVHSRLLGEGVVILEGIDLTAVEPGVYELLCLPLRIKDGDGAPARAVLREV